MCRTSKCVVSTDDELQNTNLLCQCQTAVSISSYVAFIGLFNGSPKKQGNSNLTMYSFKGGLVSMWTNHIQPQLSCSSCCITLVTPCCGMASHSSASISHRSQCHCVHHRKWLYGPADPTDVRWGCGWDRQPSLSSQLLNSEGGLWNFVGSAAQTSNISFSAKKHLTIKT